MFGLRHTTGEKMNDAKYMEEYTEMIIEECRKALHPELRDMISRGQAFDLIKKHFGIKEDE